MPRFAYMHRISRYLRFGLYDSRVKRSGAKDTEGGKEVRGVGERTMREELNREEATNVAVKQYVYTHGDVRSRKGDRTEGRERVEVR